LESELAKLLLFTVGGLANAAYLFIVAAGLSLVFGALRVINMAHGSLYTVSYTHLTLPTKA